MAKTINEIKNQWQIIGSEIQESANTASRVGSAGYDLAVYADNISQGQISLGTVANLTALNAIVNPSKGDRYIVSDQINPANSLPYYYVWSGSAWVNTGETIINADAATKTDLAVKTSRTEAFNISQYNDNYGFLTKLGARRAIPENTRALGQIISYRLDTGEWVTEQYDGKDTDVSTWENESNWLPYKENGINLLSLRNGSIFLKRDIYYRGGSQNYLNISLKQGNVLIYDFVLSESGFAMQFQAVNSSGDILTLKEIPASENTGTFSGTLYITQDIQNLIIYTGSAASQGKGSITLTYANKNAIVENIGQRIVSAIYDPYVMQGYIDKATGNFITSALNVMATDFIKVEVGESIYICGAGSSGNSACYALFDSQEQFIRSVSGTEVNEIEQIYIVESGVSYIRSTKWKNGIGYILCKSTNQFDILDKSLLSMYQKQYKGNDLYIITDRFVHRETGLDSSNINSICTDLEKWDGQDIIVYGLSGANASLIAYYDKNQRFISSIYGTAYNQKLIRIKKELVPVNSVYIRSSGNKDDANLLANGTSFNYLSPVNRKKVQFGYTANFNVTDLPEQDIATHRSLETYYSMCDELVTQYPEYVTAIDCDAEYLTANPTDNRPSELSDKPIKMYVLRPKYANVEVGHNGKQNFSELKFMITAGTHGFEWVAIQTTINFMKLICEQWNNNANVEELRFNVSFYIMPCSAPWGVVNDSRVNYNGVDPNRNTSAYDWVLAGEGTNTYSGVSPASEYETRVFEYYFNNIQPQLFIDFHNFGTDLVGNNCYVTSRNPLGRDISAIFLSAISRQWKKYNPTVYPQDTTTILGWQGATTAEKATKSVYASSKGALAWIYETCQGHVWKDGVIQPATQASPTTPKFMTESLQGFMLLVLYACKGFTDNQ